MDSGPPCSGPTMITMGVLWSIAGWAIFRLESMRWEPVWLSYEGWQWQTESRAS